MKKPSNPEFTVTEPFLDKGNIIKIYCLTKGSDTELIVDPNNEDCNKELLILTSNPPWNLPETISGFNNVKKGAPHHTELDLAKEIKDVSNHIEIFLKNHIYFLDSNYYKIIPDIIIGSYFLEYLDCFPRLVIVGGSGAGKTRLQRIFSYLMYRAIKASNTSYASAFRYADQYGSSIIFDEFQSFKGGDKDQMIEFTKNSFESDGQYHRINTNTWKNECFHVYCPVVLSVQTLKGLPPDVINRSFILRMVQLPPGMRIKRRLDTSELRTIQSELYNLMLNIAKLKAYEEKWERQTRFSLERHIQQCRKWIDMLEEDIEDHIVDSKIPESFKLDYSRLTDLADALYPFAHLTDSVEFLFNELLKTDYNSKNALRETDSGTVILAWASLIQSKQPQSQEDYFKISHKISTREIGLKYIEILTTSGDYSESKDYPIHTKDVGKCLYSLGFQTERGAHNLTYIKDDYSFCTIFKSALKSYCGGECVDYLESLTSALTNPNNKNHPASKSKDQKVNGLSDSDV